MAFELEDEIARLARCRGNPPPNESNTCEWVVLPMLRAAGYEREDIHSQERGKAGTVPDYTVLPETQHAWFVEVKAWLGDLSKEHACQAPNYANSEAGRWVVLTNGRTWRLYDNHIKGLPPAERMVGEADCEHPAALAEFVRALGKQAVQSGEVAVYAWRERLRAGGAGLSASDLNPIARAKAFHDLQHAGITQTEIGARLGIDQSSVSRTLRLLDLPESVQALLAEGRLPVEHGTALRRFRHFPEYAALVGGLAAAQRVPIALVKRGIPCYHEAVGKGLLRPLEEGACFEACLNCPDRDVAHEAGRTVCFRPSHWQDLQDAHTRGADQPAEGVCPEADHRTRRRGRRRVGVVSSPRKSG